MDDTSSSFEFDEDNIKRIKNLYSQKMKDNPDNPMKICMKLVLDSATEKDTEKRNILSYQFSEFLSKPGGVMRLFLAIVDFDTTSQKVSTHNQRFLAIANMMLGLPNICMSFDDYCCNISGQIKSLLYSDNDSHSSLGSIIIKFMIDSRRGSGDSLAEKIFQPIFNSIKDPTDHYITPIQAIKSIHNMINNHVPIRFFVPLFHDLVFVLILLKHTPSNLKKMIRTILCQILTALKPGAACCLIETTLLAVDNQTRHVFEVSVEDDGIGIVVGEELINYKNSTPFDDINETLMQLLEDCDNQSLVLEFFFHFRDAMWMSRDEIFGRKCASLVEPLLDDTIAEKPNNKFDLFDIIAANQSRTLELIVRTLSGYLNFLKFDRDDREKVVLSSIKGCLDIFEIVAMTSTNEEDFSYLKNKCLPVLIQSRDAIISYKGSNEKLRDIEQTIIDQINGLISKIDNESSDNLAREKETQNASEREYYDIIKDLNDKLVPVRVHSLVRLKQSLITNDEFVISRIPEIQSMIESSLADPEPYVFLACINLMVEMSVRKTKEILPKLIELHSLQSLDLQHRINVGEVLVKLTKQMNETTPHYCKDIMDMLFKGLKDSEELIRISCLINMGEISRNLGDSLWKYILDLLMVVEHLIESDTIQVKCAAIDLLRTTLSGLDSLKVESIQRDLNRIYKVLKKVKLRCLDEKLDIQVDLALDEIDRIARQLLGLDVVRKPGDKLVKNIRMLQLN